MIEKDQRKYTWDAAVEWWLSFVDMSYLSQDSKKHILFNLEGASEEAFNEWYEREIANPPEGLEDHHND